MFISLIVDVVSDAYGLFITFQVIMRREKGDVNFYRTWAEYRRGFGKLKGDFWIGLLNIFFILVVFAGLTQPSTLKWSVNRVPACLAGVKAGCVHLCRVEGNTV